MKKKLFILFFIFICLSLSGTTYYISPGGSDTNGSGTSSNPWKTLSYACAHTTKNGDIIHINEGTYIETNECVLAVGVSLEGVGASSIIKSHYVSSRTGAGINHASITLLSSNEGTDGNQHISNLKLDGDGLTGSIGIVVKRRSNVKIHDITIVDFYINGITFSGATDYGRPVIYATGNEIYNTIITNCGQEEGSWDGGGLIQMGGQDGMLIHDNILNETSRSQGHNGNIVNGAYYNKGVKYYRNKSYKPDYDGQAWNFHIESWNVEGGFEIYDNEFYGGDTAVDCGGIFNKKGDYNYSFYIHDNLFTGSPIESYNGKYSICIEGNSTNDVWIYRNHFLNLPHPIQQCDGITGACEARRIYICNNIMENCGWNVGGSYMNIIEFVSDKSVDVLSDIFIYNNLIMGGNSTHTSAIKIEINGTVSNFNIKNNIIFNNSNGSFLNVVNSNSFDGLYIDYNDLYHNANSNPSFSGNPVKNYEYSNNINVDPLFVSATDFQLSSGSPCIDKGTDVGLPYQGKAPDIGAFEFPSDVPPPVPVFVSAVVENSAPAILEMTYDLILNSSIIPSSSSFGVFVNSISRKVNSVSISGKKVQLTLAEAIVYGDLVTVSYTKPTINPVQNISGGEVANITYASVTNNCESVSIIKVPPVVIINLPDTVYAGFVNTIDATSTYDPNNDPLIVNWSVPSDLPVSATVNKLKIQFLAPIVENPVDLHFQLKVSSTDTLLTNDITIKVLPYKPGLDFVRITKIKASDFNPPDYPENVLDGNTLTKWSSNGNNKWLMLTFAEPFKISYIELAFLNGQQYESFFDIYASKDSITWEPILEIAASCNFSGERQVFKFPIEKVNTEYSYLKYIGYGSAINTWNYISEIKIFGSPGINPGSGESDTRKVIIYPNPATNYLNISIIDTKMKPDDLRIRDLSGKTVFEKILNPDNQNLQFPIALKPGVYVLDLVMGKSTLFSQKLIIVK